MKNIISKIKKNSDHMKKIKTIEVGTSIFEENEKIAEENRLVLSKTNTFAVNIMGSPGSGKTSLLEKTISELKDRFSFAVIEGDIKGSLDGERLAKLDIPVIQINTGGACHLDAFMVKKGLENFRLKDIDIIFVENVGNLVCPAEFKIGTSFNVVVSSVPEGEDKPLKYPLMFKIADICILNKTDLLPHTDFDLDTFKKYLKDISLAQFIPLSVKTEEGFSIWIEAFSDIVFKQLHTLQDAISVEWKGKIVIAGMGDRMKADDGAGSVIAEKLAKIVKRKDVKIIDTGNSIENYIGVIERFKPNTVVVMDAVDFGGKPGEIKTLEYEELQELTTSTHSFSISVLLNHIHNQTGANCKVIGIQPEIIKFSQELSIPVKKSIEKLIEIITYELCR
ncbi:MAG: hydrogenase nickel incorporation protein HypB [Candidatus Omnitrophica bacterium]|nr:hydrogenase nickel incorporation protein HypB [Candidatus Omnitrophota bacterium]